MLRRIPSFTQLTLCVAVAGHQRRGQAEAARAVPQVQWVMPEDDDSVVTAADRRMRASGQFRLTEAALSAALDDLSSSHHFEDEEPPSPRALVYIPEDCDFATKADIATKKVVYKPVQDKSSKGPSLRSGNDEEDQHSPNRKRKVVNGNGTTLHSQDLHYYEGTSGQYAAVKLSWQPSSIDTIYGDSNRKKSSSNGRDIFICSKDHVEEVCERLLASRRTGEIGSRATEEFARELAAGKHPVPKDLLDALLRKK